MIPFITNFFSRHKHVLEYIPVVLVTLLLVAEVELEKHAVNLSCQLAITIFVLGIFFFFVSTLKSHRIIAFVICIVTWIALVYCKQKYISRVY